jgi:hypothetical protein
MKHIFLAIALLLSSHVARSAPIGAVVQTWHHDPQTNLVTVTIVNTSQKDITAFNLSLKITYQSGVSQYQWLRDLLNNAVFLERYKGTPNEQSIRQQLGPVAFPAGGSYDEKIPVQPDFKDFEAVLDVVAFSDKTAEATNATALGRLVAQRKATALSIQKAVEIIDGVLADSTVTNPHGEAATKVQKRLDAWKATVHYDVVDMDEGELIGMVRDLKNVPAVRGSRSETDYLKTYIDMKEKERATWADQAQLVTGRQP